MGHLLLPLRLRSSDYFGPWMALSGSRFRDGTGTLAIPPDQRYVQFKTLIRSKPILAHNL